MTKDLAPIRTAVVHPVDAPSLLGAVEAAKAGLILPVLVGPEAKIRAAAAQAALDLAPYEIVPTEHSDAAAAAAVAMVRAGRSEEHTSELQSLMRISYAVFCLKKKKQKRTRTN